MIDPVQGTQKEYYESHSANAAVITSSSVVTTNGPIAVYDPKKAFADSTHGPVLLHLLSMSLAFCGIVQSNKLWLGGCSLLLFLSAWWQNADRWFQKKSQQQQQQQQPPAEQQEQEDAVKQQMRTYRQRLYLGFLLLMWACLSLAGFGWFAKDLANYKYLGSMRAIAYSTQLTDYTGSYYSGCGMQQYSGTVKLAWGGEWGCPNNPDTECQASVVTSLCTAPICLNSNDGNSKNSESSVYNRQQQCLGQDDAAEQSENCLDGVFGKVTDLTEAGVQYDPTIAPEDDPNGWPTMEAYGDCSSCDAVLQSMWKKDHETMFIMRAVCLASLAVGSVQLLRAWIMNRITSSSQQSTVSGAGLLPNHPSHI